MCRILIFYVVLLVGFRIYFFTSRWQAGRAMVCGSLFFPHGVGGHSSGPQQCIEVSPPLPPLSLYCFLLLFDVFCRPHVYCGCWLLARRPVIPSRCSRLGRGVLSRRGLCFLFFLASSPLQTLQAGLLGLGRGV